MRVRGFTLIELMVVLAVVAILAAIAVPAYSSQVRRSHRADAIDGVSDLQLRQERWRADHPEYAPDMDTLLGSAASTTSYNNAHSYYNFAISGKYRPCYEVVV
jgi:type IV pilus assembly protein PilE